MSGVIMTIQFKVRSIHNPHFPSATDEPLTQQDMHRL